MTTWRTYSAEIHKMPDGSYEIHYFNMFGTKFRTVKEESLEGVARISYGLRRQTPSCNVTFIK